MADLTRTFRTAVGKHELAGVVAEIDDFGQELVAVRVSAETEGRAGTWVVRHDAVHGYVGRRPDELWPGEAPLKRHDPTHGQIDFDIQDFVDEVYLNDTATVGQRVAIQRTFQDRRNEGRSLPAVDAYRERKAAAAQQQEHDAVDHPAHYTGHPSGVECITITEHMGFNLGNAVKYVWRADLKGDAIEDLRKAAWYIDREIQRRERSTS